MGRNRTTVEVPAVPAPRTAPDDEVVDPPKRRQRALPRVQAEPDWRLRTAIGPHH